MYGGMSSLKFQAKQGCFDGTLAFLTFKGTLSYVAPLNDVFPPPADVPLPLKTLLMKNKGQSYDVGDISRSTVNNSWFLSEN